MPNTAAALLKSVTFPNYFSQQSSKTPDIISKRLIVVKTETEKHMAPATTNRSN